MPLKNVQSRESSLQTLMLVNMFTFMTTLTVTNNLIHMSHVKMKFLQKKSPDSAHCAGSKEFQTFYSSACHFALVLQLDKEG